MIIYYHTNYKAESSSKLRFSKVIEKSRLNHSFIDYFEDLKENLYFDQIISDSKTKFSKIIKNNNYLEDLKENINIEQIISDNLKFIKSFTLSATPDPVYVT